MNKPIWRVGSKVPINVYRNDEPVFQCHTAEMAAEVVANLNVAEIASELYKAVMALPLDAFDKPMEEMDAADFSGHAGEFVEAMQLARIALGRAK